MAQYLLFLKIKIVFNLQGEVDMDSDNFLDQEYENLNNAILKAIVGSEDVQNILARVKKLDQMDDKAVLNLFLSLAELQQMSNKKYSEPRTYKMEPNSTVKPMDNEETPILGTESIVDGEILTKNEVLFEKFFQGRFNESSWMKKARVHF
jgi:hypothetical protein